MDTITTAQAREDAIARRVAAFLAETDHRPTMEGGEAA